MYQIKKVNPIEFWHVVDVGDNRSSADPFRVKLSPLTAREYNAEQRGAIEKRLLKNGTDNLQEALVESHVVEIENCLADGKEIKTGKGLIEAVLSAAPSSYLIISDIYNALLVGSDLDQGVQKN